MALRSSAHGAFGRLPGGETVSAFTLSAGGALEVRIIDYGATIVGLLAPGPGGLLEDVVLDWNDLETYLASPFYLGAVAGRYANRIAGGRFTVDGRTHQLSVNNGANHLHGGHRGFDKVRWHADPQDRPEELSLTHTSPAGDEGYPGRLTARVRYTVTRSDELVVTYHAVTDAPTPVNLTQHSYFNLAGRGARDVLDHELTVHADAFTPVDERLIPTGDLAPVAGTPFDFRQATPIGARIQAADPQLARGRGYDHNFVLRRSGPGLVHAARLEHAPSRRRLDIHTTEPGLQVYSGNYLDGTGGFGPRAGVCLETQHFPDSPNQEAFPPAILRPGEEYHSTTVWSFSATP